MATTYTTIVDPGNEQVDWTTDYTSLNAWAAGEGTEYSSGDIAVADCRRSTSAKDAAFSVTGWTSGVIPKIIVNSDYRHDGKWADQNSLGNYVYVVYDTSTVNASVYINMEDAVVSGLLVEKASTSGYHAHGIQLSDIDGALAESCIAKYSGSGSTEYYGIRTTSTSTSNSVTVRNCAAIGAWKYGFYFYGNTTKKTKVHNITAYGCLTGIRCQTWNGAELKNSCAGNCTTADYSGWSSTDTDYNVSSDTTAPGTNKATGKTSYTDYFVSPSTGDFHLKDTSYNLWGINSENLYSTFTDDIDGDTRANSNQFGIGADYYVASGGDSLPISVAVHHLNQMRA
jgi:hypothetical protein